VGFLNRLPHGAGPNRSETAMKKAFTLIELLVVIAIIAILAAILFPVFAQAKLAAKKTQGLAQAKQVGTATEMYLSDSDDVLPSYRFSVPDAAEPINPFYLKLKAAGDARAATLESQGVRTIHAVFYNQLIEPYTKNNDLFKAPTNSEAWANWQDKGTWDNGFHSYGGQNSYGLNNYLLQSNKGTASSIIAEPSNTLLMVDATYYNTLPAQPTTGNCTLNGLNPGNSASYPHYWKHLGNSKLNFNALGNADPDNASNASVWNGINNRYGGVLNVVRTDTSAKAINGKQLVYDLRSKGTASVWNPTKGNCE
jgi:prepilin-type N-terminal cleavage/methylation domain-containing protein